jgi:hypothetical protein
MIVSHCRLVGEGKQSGLNSGTRFTFSEGVGRSSRLVSVILEKISWILYCTVHAQVYGGRSTVLYCTTRHSIGVVVVVVVVVVRQPRSRVQVGRMVEQRAQSVDILH